jgi:hypothetical protein
VVCQVLLKDSHYVEAKHEYTLGGEQLDRMDEAATSAELKQQAEALRLSLRLNCTLCLLKLHQWGEAIEAADSVLAIDSSSVKGLYRRAQVCCCCCRSAAVAVDQLLLFFFSACVPDGDAQRCGAYCTVPCASHHEVLLQARKELHQWDQAKIDLQLAAAADPNDKAGPKLLREIAKEEKAEQKKQKAVMQKAFGGKSTTAAVQSVVQTVSAAAAEEDEPEPIQVMKEEEAARGSSTHVDLNNLKDSGTGELTAEEFAALRAKTKTAAEVNKNMTAEQQAEYGCKTGVAASAVRPDSDDSDDEGADFAMGGEGQGALLGDY